MSEKDLIYIWGVENYERNDRHLTWLNYDTTPSVRLVSDDHRWRVKVEYHPVPNHGTLSAMTLKRNHEW